MGALQKEGATQMQKQKQRCKQEAEDSVTLSIYKVTLKTKCSRGQRAASHNGIGHTCREEIVVNMYVPNNIAIKCKGQKVLELEGELPKKQKAI